MTDRDCAWLRSVADELALGVLSGQERAEAIAHLDRCPACREHVERLTLVGDGLLCLLPGSEPPAGFETRVMDRLRLNRPARRRRPRAAVAVAAAAATALGFGFGGWAVGTAIEGASAPSSPSSEPSGAEHGLLAASLLAPGHRPVGRIFAYTGSPGWIYMSVDLGRDWSGSGSQAEEESVAIDSRNGYDEYPEAGKVSCRLERSDGTSVRIGEFALDDAGRGYWGAPTRVDLDTVSGARLLNADGSVLATAHFDARDN
ncbi:zf-HC2 domain-containing protein [Streptomyces sp. NPDC056464]|uniref:zf-HC2 domain-containing protein n=1 Tax=Streptomyces sp. NPDC056464 TaxID=3345828 RepID=UPI0036875622